MNSPLLFTTNKIPRTVPLRQKLQIPYGAVFSPLSCATSVFNFSPPRCSSCGAYLTPGSPSMCVFCRASSDSVYGTVIPESCEFEIQNGEQQKSKSIFLIDASSIPHDSEVMRKVLEVILLSIPNDSTNLAFIMLTNELTFLMEGNKIGVITDLKDAIIPQNAFLKKKPKNLYTLINFPHKMKGPDLIGALKILEKAMGKYDNLFMFINSVPSGDVSLSRVNVEAESIALRGPNYESIFKDFEMKFRRKGVTVDAFVYSLSSRLIDCPSINKFCSGTGGKMFYMNSSQEYNIENVLLRFLKQKHAICQMKISDNAKFLPSLGIIQHNPNSFIISTYDSLTFPIVMPNNLNSQVIIQAVVQFLDDDGKIKRRVYTRSIDVTDDLSMAVNEINGSVVLKYISSSLIGLFYNQKIPLSKMKDYALGLLKPIFFSYRYHVSRNPNRFNSLVMPNSLKLLPYQVLGILKSTAFSQGISFDERGFQFGAIDNMEPDELLNVGFPQLMEITSFIQNQGEIMLLSLSEIELKTDRLIMLFDNFTTYVWVGRNIDQSLCEKIFGVSNPYLVKEIKPFDNEESMRFYSLLRGNIRLFREDENNTNLILLNRFVDDSSPSMPSYALWLSQLHRISLPQDQ